ncbi:MAG: oligosaccharide flippase family protein [Acidimicrobiales bacterium]
MPSALRLPGGLGRRLAGMDRHQRDSLLTAGSQLFVYGLSVLTGPMLARALDAEGRGDLAAVLVGTQLFGWLATFGIPAATAYHATTMNRRELNMSAWFFSLLVGLPVVAVIWPFVPRYLNDHDPATVIWFRLFLLAALTILPQYSCLNYVNGRGDNVRFNALRHLALLSNSLVIMVLFLTDRLNLISALQASFFSNLGAAAVTFTFAWGWPSRGFSWSAFRKQLDYGWRVALGSVAQMMVGRLDQIVMVGLVASEQLGLYAVAVTAAGVSGALAVGMGLAVFPHIRDAPDHAARRATLRRGLRWMSVCSIGMATTIGLSAGFVIPLLFGKSFRGSLNPLYVLLPGQVCFDLANVIGQALQAEGRPGTSSRALTLAAVITATTITLAVGRYGLVGAALVTTTSQAAYLVYVSLAIRRPPRSHQAGPTPNSASGPAMDEAASPTPV